MLDELADVHREHLVPQQVRDADLVNDAVKFCDESREIDVARLDNVRTFLKSGNVKDDLFVKIIQTHDRLIVINELLFTIWQNVLGSPCELKQYCARIFARLRLVEVRIDTACDTQHVLRIVCIFGEPEINRRIEVEEVCVLALCGCVECRQLQYAPCVL